MERNQANGEPHGRSDADAILKTYPSVLRLHRQPLHAKEESNKEGINKANQSLTLVPLGSGKGYAV